MCHWTLSRGTKTTACTRRRQGSAHPACNCHALHWWQLASRAGALCWCRRWRNSSSAPAPAAGQVCNFLAPFGIRLLPDQVVDLQPLALWAARAPGLPRRRVALLHLPSCRLVACQGQLAQPAQGLTTASACRQGSCSGALVVDSRQQGGWASVDFAAGHPRAGSPQSWAATHRDFPVTQPFSRALSVNMHMCAIMGRGNMV